MRYLIVLVMVGLASCDKPPPHVDPPFTKYVDTFAQLTGQRPAITIQFDTLTGALDGRCTLPGDDWPKILISKLSWDNASDDFKEQLILHELGHCIFRLVHDEGTVTLDGVEMERSIMAPKTFGWKHSYSQNKKYYYSQYLSLIPR